MGRDRQMKKPEALTIVKTNGWTITDEEVSLVLAMIHLLRRQNGYLSRWGGGYLNDINHAKRKGLVTWDRRQRDQNVMIFAGLRLTDKGEKVLRVAHGKQLMERGLL